MEIERDWSRAQAIRPSVSAVRESPGTNVFTLTTAASSSGTDCACAAVATASSIAGARTHGIQREQARRIVMRDSLMISWPKG